jgi:hypothetical protein
MKPAFSSSSAHADHPEAWQLLPWYVNSTLKERELALVRRHLKVCITCRKELEVQRKMAEVIRDSDVIPLAPQVGFSHLRQRLDVADQAAVQRVGLKWWRLPRSGSAHASAGSAHVPGRIAVALSLCASLAIAIALPNAQWPTAVKEAKDEPQYRTLSAAADWPTARKGEIYVVFSRAMTHEHIGRLLRSVQAEIVDGPNAIGVYRLRVGVDGKRGRDAPTVAKQLRRHPGVRLAELALASANFKGAGH